MNAGAAARQKTPARARAQSRSAPRHTPLPAPTEPLPRFGTRGESTALATPPLAAAAPPLSGPPQTPSSSLSGRTVESLRLARERQFHSAKKATRAPAPETTSTKPAPSTKTPISSLRTNRSIPSSVSRPRLPTTTSFNPSRSRPTTPVTAFQASTPTTPSRSKASSASTPNTTPKSVRVTSAGSSVLVRDAIRKAKAIHKQQQKTPPSASINRINYSNETSYDDIDNPFNISTGTPPLQAQLKRAIENGRTTGIYLTLNEEITAGNLNISNLELQEIPDDVYSMYDLSSKTVVVDFSIKSSGWFESVDLQRFNAAGNEISQIDERVVQEFGAIKHFDVPSVKSLLF